MFGFSLNHEEADERPTWPPTGSATLVIEDKYCPLFTSATWCVQATVNGTVIAHSSDSDEPHTAGYVRRWARKFIRTRYDKLRSLGVDACAEYVLYGGSVDDLD